MVAKEYYTYAGNAGRNRRILTLIRDGFFSSVDFPAPFRPIIPTTSPCSTSNDTSFERPELIYGLVGFLVKDPVERRLHRIDNRIVEREVFLLRSANGVFLAGIADADGGVI